MTKKDAENVIKNLQRNPFICGEDVIVVSGGYVILKKEEYERLKKGEEADVD